MWIIVKDEVINAKEIIRMKTDIFTPHTRVEKKYIIHIEFKNGSTYKYFDSEEKRDKEFSRVSNRLLEGEELNV